MNTILLFLIMTPLLGDSSTQDTYSSKDRYNDSLHIYRTYLNLSKIHETDTAILNSKIRKAHEITCAAQSRLSAYNHKPYTSILGLYPKPSEIEHKGIFITSGPQLHYVFYDYQTRFITKADGKTKTPYIRRLTFDKGRIIEIELLNPVTLKKLP